jgi:hypothetical protein
MANVSMVDALLLVLDELGGQVIAVIDETGPELRRARRPRLRPVLLRDERDQPASKPQSRKRVTPTPDVCNGDSLF